MLKIQFFYTILSRFSKREKVVFYTALFFISLTLVDRLMISPVIYKIKSLNKEIQAKETEIKGNLRLLTHKDRILAESKQYSSYASSLRSEEEEMTSFLKEIENSANKTSIYLIDMKPGGVKEVDSSKRYFVNLNCEAQMEQLVNFMHDIENSDKLLIVDKYQISPKSKESSSIVRCRMTISKVALP